LVAYIVKTQPGLVEVKAANGATPLQIAYRLGRLDAAKILINAGADQTTKDRDRSNLLHAALAFAPKARRLKPMLDLLDRDVLIPMLKERKRFEDGGRTPLHELCVSSGKLNIKYSIPMIQMLIDLSPETARQAFKMLDGAGDTPLHTLLAADANPAVIRTIIDFDPSLLCCENAVGRTPAELVHDRHLADRIVAPSTYTYRQDNSVSTLVDKQPYLFKKKEASSSSSAKPKEHDAATTTAAQNWRLCAATMARNGQPKRTLVSLHSANFVAQRLGEQHTRDRYKFRIPATEAEGDSVSVDSSSPSSSQDSDGTSASSQDSESEVKPGPAAIVVDTTKRRRKDIVTERYYANSGYYANSAWAQPKRELKEGDSVDSDGY
jgi:hypothetical protein